MTEISRPQNSTHAVPVPAETTAAPTSSSLIAEPEAGSAGLLSLEELLLDLKSKDKEFARERQLMAERCIDQATNKLINEMKDQAQYQMYAGLVSGLSTAASGALNITGGLNGTEAGMKIWGGAAQLATAGGQMDSTLLGAGAESAKINVTQAQGEVASAQRLASEAQEAKSGADQELREMIARVDRLVQAEEGARQAALFRA